MMNQYDTLAQATKALRDRGYASEFHFTNEGLINKENNRSYDEHNLEIVEYHRFEGISNPSDMSVIYALESEDGCKGVIISPYGPYADPALMDFLDKLTIRPLQD